MQIFLQSTKKILIVSAFFHFYIWFKFRIMRKKHWGRLLVCGLVNRLKSHNNIITNTARKEGEKRERRVRNERRGGKWGCINTASLLDVIPWTILMELNITDPGTITVLLPKIFGVDSSLSLSFSVTLYLFLTIKVYFSLIVSLFLSNNLLFLSLINCSSFVGHHSTLYYR